MPKLLTVADNNYSHGMNTVDDPKILKDGECVELVNALPGYPLVVRKGCAARGLEYLGFPLEGSVSGKPFYAHFEGLEVLFFWLRGFGGYGAYSLRGVVLGGGEEMEAIPVEWVDGSGSVEFPAHPGNLDFDFVKIKNIVHTRASDGRMWAIERDGAKFTARTVPSVVNYLNEIIEPDVIPISGGEHTGPFIYGYSATFVRRETANANVYEPGVIESPESVSGRRSVIFDYADDASMWRVSLYILAERMPPPQYGFTHVRLYRTANLNGLFGAGDDNFMTESDWAGLTPLEKQKAVAGAERYFLVDIPIPDIMSAENGAYRHIDGITDGELSGEMNLLESDMYTLPPNDGYRMYYHKDRLFILGGKGAVYFSEIPGGGGGGNLESAQLTVDKYALWFKPLRNRLDLDIEEQTPVLGVRALNDDLFFFKSDSVFMVVAGDPLSAPLRKINDQFGCPFPDTIINSVVSGEETLFYLSGAGPVLVHTGGNYKPFTDFKVKGIWGHLDGELLRLPRGDVEWCRAAFWNDTVWVFYKHQGRTARIYGYLSREGASGAFGVETGGPSGYRYALQGIAVTDTNKAVTVCANGRGETLFVDFMGAADYDDELGDGLSARVTFKLYSRLMYPGPKERSMSELFRAAAYCAIHGTDTFTFAAFNNRTSATFDYARDGKDGPHVWENDTAHPIEDLRRCVTFTPKADFVGEYFQYMVEKTVPPEGAFAWYGVEMESIPRPQLDTENFMPTTRTTTSNVHVAAMSVYIGAAAKCDVVMVFTADVWTAAAVTGTVSMYVLPDMTQNVGALAYAGAAAKCDVVMVFTADVWTAAAVTGTVSMYVLPDMTQNVGALAYAGAAAFGEYATQ